MTGLARVAPPHPAVPWSTRLERAFLDGYGGDPRDPSSWRRDLLREAVGTAIWAHVVGDEEFERQGHRMITDALGDRS